MHSNLWSFIWLFLCLPFLLLTIFSPAIFKLFQMTSTHPLYIVLGMTFRIFFLGLIGLKDIDGWKASDGLMKLLLTRISYMDNILDEGQSNP